MANRVIDTVLEQWRIAELNQEISKEIKKACAEGPLSERSFIIHSLRAKRDELITNG